MNGKAGEDMSNPTLGNVPPPLPCPRPHAQLTWLCAVCAQIFFFLQCFFGSTFFLLQKSVLSRYPPLQTTCWGYCMGACILVLVVIPQATEASDWHISTGQGLAVLYAIFIQSVRTSHAHSLRAQACLCPSPADGHGLSPRRSATRCTPGPTRTPARPSS